MKWTLIIFIILFANIVIADRGQIEVYKPREVMDLSIHLTNKTGAVTGANCSANINNETYDLVENIQMNDIGGGWYNSTYNTSKKGKYFCTQNCTRSNLFVAGTCDFVIEGEDSMALGMIVFIPLFIAIFMLVVSWMLEPEKYWALKLGLIMMGFVFIFQAYHMSSLAINEIFASDNLQEAIGDSTWIYGMMFVVIISVFIITFIVDIFRLMAGKKYKTGGYNEE